MGFLKKLFGEPVWEPTWDKPEDYGTEEYIARINKNDPGFIGKHIDSEIGAIRNRVDEYLDQDVTFGNIDIDMGGWRISSRGQVLQTPFAAIAVVLYNFIFFGGLCVLLKLLCGR